MQCTSRFRSMEAMDKKRSLIYTLAVYIAIYLEKLVWTKTQAPGVHGMNEMQMGKSVDLNRADLGCRSGRRPCSGGGARGLPGRPVAAASSLDCGPMRRRRGDVNRWQRHGGGKHQRPEHTRWPPSTTRLRSSSAPCCPSSPTRAGSSSRASRRAPSSYITSTGEGVDLQVSVKHFALTRVSLKEMFYEKNG